MVRTITVALICMAAALCCAAQTTIQDTYPIIVMGTVTMEDGTAPSFSVLIERKCTDPAGDAPGPLTNKKGEWVWRMQFDSFDPRACWFQASHPGFTSTTIQANYLNIGLHDTTRKVPALVIVGATSDPYNIHVSADNMGRATGPFTKAMKALDAHKVDEALAQLHAAVAAAPKFAVGWHALGVVNERMKLDKDEARIAYTHAIEADPKLFAPYVTLTRLCIRMKDWPCAVTTADSLIKVDTKHAYAEIYLHKAVAQYHLKDLAGAQDSVQQFIALDTKHKMPRAEYVLGRILEAKGDTNGATEHMSKYLELDANSPDLVQVQGHMLALGKPGAPQIEPELEPL